MVFHVALQFRIDSDSTGMSLKSSHILNFAQRIQTIFESRLVAAFLQANNPFSRSPLADIFKEIRSFKMVEQSYPLNCAISFSQFVVMTLWTGHSLRYRVTRIINFSHSLYEVQLLSAPSEWVHQFLMTMRLTRMSATPMPHVSICLVCFR